MSIVANALTIEDMRQLAGRRLPKFLFSYVERGNGNGDGVTRNIRGFEKYLTVSRCLRKVVPVDTGRTVFGRRYDLPFGISAVGVIGMYRSGAEEMLAEVARTFNIPYMHSGMSTKSIDVVARIAPDHVWCQLYASKDYSVTERMIQRARDAGIQVLVVTVDYPVPNQSEIPLRTGVSLVAGINWRKAPSILADLLQHPRWTLDFLANGGVPKVESWEPYAPLGSTTAAVAKFIGSAWPANLVWSDIANIRGLWPGKMLIKGLLDPADISMAFQFGADGVIVSNHGGNKLDCLPACIDSLSMARQTISDEMPLFFDGGIRRGADIVRATALGADFCFLGRAFLYGISVGGYAGAERVVDILRAELAYVQAMLGCPDLASLGKTHLRYACGSTLE